MDTYEATLTSKGQVTVPARLRSALGLRAGDKLVFKRDATGEVTVAAQTGSLSSLRGIVKDGAGPVTGREVARWIAESRGARSRLGRGGS